MGNINRKAKITVMQANQQSAVMMMQLSRHIGAERTHYYTSCAKLSLSRIRNTNCNNHSQRWNSGSSSNNKSNAGGAIATTVTKIRRNKRKKQPFSPLMHMASNHPKNTKPHPKFANISTSDIKLLTRKQLRRLTPKQRSNLQRHRLQQHKDSISYLQQARINVRSNLNYLSDSAGNNFQKNIKTIQRLFRGEEEVWKEEVAEGSKQQQQQQRLSSHQKQSKLRQEEEDAGLDWERLPSELKQNVKSNLTTVQNWLHKATDGMIPSPSLINNTSSSSSDVEGSVATRVQQFHQAKQNNGLVMDKKWLTWNIALALLPGAMIGLYLNSLQDEMKEYYEKLEEQERARILGTPSSESSRRSRRGSQQEQQSNDEKNGMGISSAFVVESGGVIDKVKMAVNDLFLGGVEERIGKTRDDENDEDDTKQPSDLGPRAASNDERINESRKFQSPSDSEDDDVDPAMKMLLQRIESLEKQLGVENKGSNKLSNEKGEQLQNYTNNDIKEKNKGQSPMQNRRDSSLATKWSKERLIKKTRTEVESSATNSADSEESTRSENGIITIWKFVQSLQPLLELDVKYVLEMIKKKIGIPKEDSLSESADVDETAVVGSTEKSVTDDDSEESGLPSIAEVESPTITTGGTTDEVSRTHAKGLRYWISRLALKRDQSEKDS